MEHTDFVSEIGRSVFGRNWKTPLASALRMSRRHLYRIIDGDQLLTKSVYARLLDFIRNNQSTVAQTLLTADIEIESRRAERKPLVVYLKNLDVDDVETLLTSWKLSGGERVVSLRGRLYFSLGHEPYTRVRDGVESVLWTWAGFCAACGAGFECKSGPNPSDLRARCDPCHAAR